MKPKISPYLVCVAVLIAGCSAKPSRSAEEYFREATSNFKSGALNLAIEDYRELLDQHPFSEYTEEAELKIAHAHYLDGSYAEAVVALTDFQRRHPTSSHLPFVGYMLGMCYMRQLSTIDRDQTAAQNAQTYLLTVSRQYPGSPYAELAREELDTCRENLAAHELYIAEFYEKRGKMKAAEIRLLTAGAQYGETPSAAKGLLRLAQIYRSQGRTTDAVLAYRAITQLQAGTPSAVAAQKALQDLDAPHGSLSSDPIGMLLAANGRQRSPSAFETVQIPGIDIPKFSQRPSGMPGPAIAPPFDPFGRGRTYY